MEKLKKVVVHPLLCLKCGYAWHPNILKSGEVNVPQKCPKCVQDWRVPHSKGRRVVKDGS